METWVATPCMGRSLGGFQDQVKRQLTGRLPWRRGDGKWEHTLVKAAREEARLEMVET